ncbi:hypothetical protein K440DRAFT_643918 [Wilcoxina mikolae CBS 423.85]|nr:hypothetical protein K440DRAFT_643918 [Wilcoxina mikolae CBS 423.85]
MGCIISIITRFRADPEESVALINDGNLDDSESSGSFGSWHSTRPAYRFSYSDFGFFSPIPYHRYLRGVFQDFHLYEVDRRLLLLQQQQQQEEEEDDEEDDDDDNGDDEDDDDDGGEA